MRCLLSGNDFCGGPEAMRCHDHPGDRLILSTHKPVQEAPRKEVVTLSSVPALGHAYISPYPSLIYIS